MNLLHLEPGEVAKAIKGRIERRGRHRVFVRHSGVMACYPTYDERCARCSDGDLVGTYDQAASVIDIEDDLRARLDEIQAELPA